MALLTEPELQQVAEAIERVERDTDAELVTVLAAQADDYRYIPLLWASLLALLLPGALLFFTGWLAAWHLLLVQWLTFIVHWRACNLARRQFIELNLHHTEGGTGMLIFVSEAERYVEILVDRGISSRIDNSAWESIVATFTENVRNGRVLEGFLSCIDACGSLLKQQVPATHERNELPNRLVVLES